MLMANSWSRNSVAPSLVGAIQDAESGARETHTASWFATLRVGRDDSALDHRVMYRPTQRSIVSVLHLRPIHRVALFSTRSKRSAALQSFQGGQGIRSLLESRGRALGPSLPVQAFGVPFAQSRAELRSAHAASTRLPYGTSYIEPAGDSHPSTSRRGVVAVAKPGAGNTFGARIGYADAERPHARTSG
jgi:hypothetical protein